MRLLWYSFIVFPYALLYRIVESWTTRGSLIDHTIGVPKYIMSRRTRRASIEEIVESFETAEKSNKMQKIVCNTAKTKSAGPYSIQQVVQYTLRKQGLIQRLPHLHDDIFPLHATSNTTPPLSLLARVEDFTNMHLDSFIRGSQSSPLSYVLLRCMRSTLHVVSANQYRTVSNVYNRENNRPALERIKLFGVPTKEISYFKKMITEKLQRDGPMSSVEVVNAFKKQTDLKHDVKTYSTGGKWPTTQTNVGVALHAMYAQSYVHFGLNSSRRAVTLEVGDDATESSDSSPTKSTTTWISTVNTRQYGIATVATAAVATASTTKERDDDGLTKEVSPSTDVQELMKWYFYLYGPATIQDFIWWSAQPVGTSKACLKELIESGCLTSVVVSGIMPLQSQSRNSNSAAGCSMYMSTSQVQCLDQEGQKNGQSVDAVVNARFLPYEDALLKAYKDTRHRFFLEPGAGGTPNERISSCIMWKGEAMPTIWMNGQVIGRWKWSSSSSSGLGGGRGGGSEKSKQLIICTPGALSSSEKQWIRPELDLLCSMINVDADHVEYVTMEDA